jgi:hypothetical protein
MAIRIDRDTFLGTHTWNDPIAPGITAVTTPLADPSILLDPAYGCHVDHEGFDLNQLEQEYYKAHGVSLVHDPTLYKDGAGVSGTHAIIQPWCEQSSRSDFDLVVDHSHFVYRYPIRGEAAMQISEYAEKRPELLRLLASDFKCGLDLCIDMFYRGTVQTIVHIEWDYDSYEEMESSSMWIRRACMEMNWAAMVPAILAYNKTAKSLKIDAFTAANTRAQLLFGRNSYMLVPTL